MSGKKKKVLIIGGNRFVGIRLSLLLEKMKDVEIHIVNRTGQAPHCRSAVVHKGDRKLLDQTIIEKDWDVIYDFACYTEEDASSAVNYFNKVGRYIFISTLSVYELGAKLREKDHDPLAALKAKPKSDASRSIMYQDGKQRAEHVFSKQKKFPVVCVRFPVILGEDDYTERLEFHLRKIEGDEDIYLANPQAQISLVSSKDAADFLAWAFDKDFTGPINVASPEPIQLQEFVAQIERLTGHNAKLVKVQEEDNASPLGPESDYFLDVSKLVGLGFRPRKISEWLPPLIQSLIQQKSTGALH